MSRASEQVPVVLTRALPDGPAWELLRSRTEPVLATDRRSLIDALPGASGLIAPPPLRIDREVLRYADRLQVVATVTSGVDHVAVEVLTERGIPLVSGAGAAADAVAEYVVWAMVGLHREFHRLGGVFAAGALDWPARLDGIDSREVGGGTLGLVGYGAIGRAVAARAAALPGLRVVVHDPAATPEPDGPQALSLDELLAVSTTVNVSVPLTAATHHLLGARELARMRSDAVLVNAARAGVVDHRALLEAVRQGRLKGAAIDVFDPEPPPAADLAELAATGRVLLTPHLAGVSAEGLEALARRAVDGVLDRAGLCI